MAALDVTAAPPMNDAAALMREIAGGAGAEGLDYRDVLRRFDRRGYVPFILFAAILLLAPIEFILHQVAAVTLVVCGLGLFFGAPAPWMPGFLAKRKASRAGLERLANFLQGQQGWSHLIVNPRHPEFARGAGEKVAAIGLVLLGASIATPLPDVIPALGAIALAFGLLQRDGLVMMIGTAVAFGWAAFLLTMIAGLIAGAPFAGGWAHDHAQWLADLIAPAHIGRP